MRPLILHTEIWYDGVDQIGVVARLRPRWDGEDMKTFSAELIAALIWTPRLYCSNRDLVRRYRPEL